MTVHDGLVVEPFAGPGGISEGLRLAGWQGRSLGIEHDHAACRTATGAGHWRVQADAARFPLGHLRGAVDGVAGGPPCPPWSTAGKRLGLLDQDAVLARADALATGRTPATVTWHDPRSPLCAEPMRYVHALRPRWVVLEQVPAVLPLWRHMARLLDALGYSTWTGVLSAEEYGVPQTRQRAVLTASLDTPVRRPAPTHQRFRKNTPPQLELLPRWRSWGEALGVTDRVIVSNYGTGGDPADRGERRFDEPAATITGKAGRNRVVQARRARGYDGALREPDEPSLAILGSDDNGDLRLGTATGDRPLTIREALQLQTFPAHYPLHGTREQQWTQVGNAVPPLLAAAVLRPLIHPARAAAAA